MTQHQQHSTETQSPERPGKSRWTYKTYTIAEGVGYRVFDAKGLELLHQPPYRNSPIPQGMTKQEAEADAEAALVNLPKEEPGTVKNGCTFETYPSPYGIGYLIRNKQGKPWIKQDFAPCVAGFAGMTQHGAEVFAQNVMSTLTDASW